MHKKESFKLAWIFILIFFSCTQNEELEQNFSITSNCRRLGGDAFFGNPLKKTYDCTISNREFYIYNHRLTWRIMMRNILFCLVYMVIQV